MLIGKFLTHELTIKQRGEEQEEKEEKKKRIASKDSQNDSEAKILKTLVMKIVKLPCSQKTSRSS